MATNHGPSVKDDETYEALRTDGASKEKAARIANASGASKRGGKAQPYEEWSKEELYARAKEIGIEGRSYMDRPELAKALREH